MAQQRWDVVVVGAGPAGSAAAIAARHAAPDRSVLLLDRSGFPRDKCCGDAVLGAALRRLADYGVGVDELAAGYEPADSLQLTSARGTAVTRGLPDPMYVIPRRVFDARLVAAAERAGAQVRRHTVREVRDDGTHVMIDSVIRAGVVIAADGAESVVRRAVAGAERREIAVAIRGYDAASADRTPRMVLADRPGLAYAWRFPTSSGPANVGYGHLLRGTQSASRTELISTMHRLLPGLQVDPGSLRAHRLPLSTSRRAVVASGRILLAGDAASLINPISGEGIYYAITSGLAAGTAATSPADAAASYRSTLRRRFSRHHRHVAVMSALSRPAFVLDAALRSAAVSQRVFDDIAALGLAEGLITAKLSLGLAAHLLPGRRRSPWVALA